MALYKKLTDAIGNTPLVHLPLIPSLGLYAKLEYTNPGGSVKDRPALFMIEEAERTGLLNPGGTIIDASSGNQGIAVAMIGAMKGYKVIITVSEKISHEKYQTLKAYGAQVVMCPAISDMSNPQNYHAQAVALHHATPHSFMPNQYFNMMNAQAHYSLLGPEIWRQTEGKITHFFAAAGTCGTISGVGKYLKEQNPLIKIIAMDSNNSYRATNGCPLPYSVEGMGVDFDTPVLNKNVIDEFVTVTDQEAFDMLKNLAHNYGFLVGPSSGAVAHGAYSYAQKNLKPTDLAVMIFGDSGRAYLSKNLYDYDDQEIVLKRSIKPAHTTTQI